MKKWSPELSSSAMFSLMSALYSRAFLISLEVRCRVQKVSGLEFLNFCVIILSPFLKR